MFGLGTTELIIIAVILILLFGGKKIPELTRGITESIKKFKEGASDKDEEGEDKKDSDKE